MDIFSAGFSWTAAADAAADVYNGVCPNPLLIAQDRAANIADSLPFGRY